MAEYRYSIAELAKELNITVSGVWKKVKKYSLNAVKEQRGNYVTTVIIITDEELKAIAKEIKNNKKIYKVPTKKEKDNEYLKDTIETLTRDLDFEKDSVALLQRNYAFLEQKYIDLGDKYRDLETTINTKLNILIDFFATASEKGQIQKFMNSEVIKEIEFKKEKDKTEFKTGLENLIPTKESIERSEHIGNCQDKLDKIKDLLFNNDNADMLVIEELINAVIEDFYEIK